MTKIDLIQAKGISEQITGQLKQESEENIAKIYTEYQTKVE